MGDKTGISWTDATWSPARGCSRISEGCRNCYAEKIAARFSKPGQAFHGFAQMIAPRDLLDRTGGRRDGWTRKVEFQPDRLSVPLRWKKPRRIFCSSMTDIFHESLANEQIAAVFGVMAACPQHTFQVLTKRAKRMREWFAVPGIVDLVETFRQIALAGRIEEYFAPERTVDIAEWPGYAITSRGRVLSTKRGAERDMAVMQGGQGHGRVMLYRDGVTERPLVHRLVLAAFDREPRDEEQGCHVTGDATNNCLWNLRWGSQSENWDDRKRHGNRRSYTKLTAEQVCEIRELGGAGINGAEIGRRFGISDTQARNIVAGKQWTPEYRPEWPLLNCWLGVSCENQAAADERIPELLATPAAVRFLSCEPLIGPIDLTRIGAWRSEPLSALEEVVGHIERPGLGWIIVGCESGPGARPCSVDWLRSLRDQCEEAGVPLFLKQAVGTAHEDSESMGLGAVECDAGSKRKSGGVIELPYLDGVQHANFPEVQS